MAVFPCPNKSTCGDCYDPPILNLSAEALDRNAFFPQVPSIPWTPPLGHWYNSWLCGHECLSYVSQADADACAANFITFCGRPNCVDDCQPPGGDGGPGGGGGNPGGDHNNTPPASSAEKNCSDHCLNGDLFTITIPAGTVVSPISQEDADNRAQAICFQQLAARKLCFGFDMAPGCVNVVYGHIFSVTGGKPPYLIQMDAATAPNGFTLNPASGLFEGTCTTAGLYNIVMSATDSSVPPVVIHKTFPVRFVEITAPAALPAGSVGVAYTTTLTQSGGLGGTWQVTSGALPDGLSLDPTTGVISGTPTTGGDFDFVVSYTQP